MAYFIIFLSIAAVLGPLMAVMPTRSQRALAAIRDTATAHGVHIALREPDNIPPRLRRISDVVLVCYSLRLTPRDSRDKTRELWVRTRDGWQSRSGDPVPQAVLDLPESAEVAQIGWDDVRVFWSERGGEEALQAVLSALARLRGAQAPVQSGGRGTKGPVP